MLEFPLQNLIGVTAIFGVVAYYFLVYRPAQARATEAVTPIELRDALAIMKKAGGVVEYEEGFPPFSYTVVRRGAQDGLLRHIFVGNDPSSTQERIEMTEYGRRLVGLPEGETGAVFSRSTASALPPSQV